jgi:hypothetical protein
MFRKVMIIGATTAAAIGANSAYASLTVNTATANPVSTGRFNLNGSVVGVEF